MSLPIHKMQTIDCKQNAVRTVRYNVDGNYCLTCGSDRTIKLWNPNKSLLLQKYSGHGSEMLDIQASHDSGLIASGGLDKYVYIWDVSSADIVRRWHGHASQVNCVRFNSDSSVVMSGSVDGTLKCWDCKSRNRDPIQVLDEAKDSVSCVDVTDHEIVTGSLDGSVRRYDLRMGIMNAYVIKVPVTCVSFTKDRQCLLVSALNSTVKLIDKESGDKLAEYKSHRNTKYRVDSCLTASDKIVLSGSEDGFIYCWDLIEGSLLNKLHHSNHKSVHSISAHPSENKIISAAENLVYVWSDEATDIIQ